MVGETLSHYRVIRSVGGGGMGEVYEAEDLRLGRHVALKVVSASYKQSPTAYQRLEREARAASSLNHPHICTIYDFFEHDGQPVIAMELLEGRSLADLMRVGHLDNTTVLRVAEQAADGLDAAHRAGVVHRDITPGNIFVTNAGDVKILDFGLAKCGPDVDCADPGLVATREAAGADVLTQQGQLVGTIAYMSPEQVRGEALDARTDLFSYGSVLYEMVTGRRAFEGRTSAMIFEAILHATPAPLHESEGRRPPGLQPIIEKALEKDRKLRYQSAADVKADLMRLERTAASAAGSRPSLLARRRRAVMAVGVFGAAVLAVALWAWVLPDRRMPAGVLKPVTSSVGVETDPAFSPDGGTLAYSSNEGGNLDIWLVDAAVGTPPQRWTTAPSAEEHASWFPDGRSLAFQSDRGGKPGIWRAPRLRSDFATPIVEDGRTPAVSPDGKRIAFTTYTGGQYLRVAVVEVADPSRVTFLTGEGDGRWHHQRPAWSPLGDWIGYQAMDGIWVVPSRGGKARRINKSAMAAIAPTWSSNGRSIYYSLLSNGQFVLWRMPLTGENAERVTTSTEFQQAPSVSDDGRLLAFSTKREARHLLFLNLETRLESIVESSSRDDWYPALAPDRSAVFFVSNRWGRTAGIWKQALSGDTPTGDAQPVVTHGGDAASIEVSPDGRWLVYCLMDGQAREVWVAPAEPGRGAAIRVSDAGVNAIHPTWRPDSRAVAFIVEKPPSQQVWTRRVDGGRPQAPAEQVTKAPVYYRFPAWIDADHLAVVMESGEVAMLDLTGRVPPRQVTHGVDALRIRVNRERRMLLVAGWWGSVPRQYELRGLTMEGTLLPLASFASFVFGREAPSAFFDLPRDGRLLAATRVSSSGDLWILESQDRRRY